MKPNLYICHTAYQVLVDLLRPALRRQAPHNGALRLRARHRRAGGTSGRDGRGQDCPCRRDTLARDRDGLFAHRRAARAFEKLCGWKLNRAAFENVYIHNDWSVLGRYLQDCRAGYILCEDTFGSTLGPDQHLVTDQRAAADFAAKQRGKGYLYWATARGASASRVRTPRGVRCFRRTAW